jgi:hypothetical protein
VRIGEAVSIGGRRSVNSFVSLSPIPYAADVAALAKRGIVAARRL